MSFATPPVPAGGRGPEWASRFPVYQIDFTAVASGKRIATTKRRVRWRFGISNKEALENGETGTSCRGEEHDVTIVWSVTSGKRLVLCDGQEVHYSTNRTSVLEYSWTMRGSHVLKVIAHAAPSLTASPGFRQYDFFVNGQSFFNMPKVYELGLRGPIPSQDRIPGVIPPGQNPAASGRYYDLNRGEYIGAPTTREQEEEDLQRAISASIEESKHHLSQSSSGLDNTPAPATSSRNLLDFSGGAPPPGPSPTAPPPHPTQALVPSAVPSNPYAQPGYATSYPPAPAPYYGGTEGYPAPPPPVMDNNAAYYAQPSPSPVAPPSPMYPMNGADPSAGYPASAYPAAPPVPIPTDPGTYSAQPPVPDTYAAQPPPVYSAPTDIFSQPVAPVVNDPFAPQPVQSSFNDISNTILGAYGTPDTMPTPAPQTSEVLPPDAAPQEETTPQEDQPSSVALSMNNLTLDAPKEEEPKNEFDIMMKKIINVNDITSPPENEKSLTLNPFADDRQKQDQDKKTKQNKSRGIPPPAAGWAGPQPTLAEMKAVRPQTGPKDAVMQSPFSADAQHAGALVVHGTQPGGYGQGPPPIAQGFGLGTTLPGGGYGGAPGQAPAYAPNAYSQTPQYDPNQYQYQVGSQTNY